MWWGKVQKRGVHRWDKGLLAIGDAALDPVGTATLHESGDATSRAETLCHLPSLLFPASTGTRNSTCPFPVAGAGAHLHAWDSRGAVFAIDARETL